MFWVEKNGDILLFVIVTPKASKDEVIGVREDAFGQHRLAIRLRAIPENGKANKSLIAFIAKQTGIAKSYLSLISGEASRQKNIKIALPLEEAMRKIQHLYPTEGERKK